MPSANSAINTVLFFDVYVWSGQDITGSFSTITTQQCCHLFWFLICVFLVGYGGVVSSVIWTLYSSRESSVEWVGVAERAGGAGGRWVVGEERLGRERGIVVWVAIAVRSKS
jgi:hypothetical protein